MGDKNVNDEVNDEVKQRYKDFPFPAGRVVFIREIKSFKSGHVAMKYSIMAMDKWDTKYSAMDKKGEVHE